MVKSIARSKKFSKEKDVGAIADYHFSMRGSVIVTAWMDGLAILVRRMWVFWFG